MSKAHKIITDLDKQHELFIVPEEELKPNFFFFWHQEQVRMGEQWLLFCDGALREDKTLGAGRHIWWNGFHKWKAQRIKLKVEQIPITVQGRVRGPSLSQDVTGLSTSGEFACDVTVGLELSCRISDYKPFIRFREPLSVFFASISNMVNEEIGKLHYDQYGDWATQLRQRIKERLGKGGSDDSEHRIGMAVEEVFVIGIEPDNAQDRAMAAQFHLVQKAKQELATAEANAQRDKKAAESFRIQGGILDIAPSLLKLQDSPLGRELLARDTRLSETMLAMGINIGGTTISMQGQNSPFGGDQVTGSLYINPPQSSQGLPNPPPTSSSTTGSLGTSQPLFSTSDPDGDGPAVDRARREAELEALTLAGFVAASIKGSRGVKEWTLIVSRERDEGILTITFHCPVGYPALPPTVEVKTPSGGGLGLTQPNTVKNWNVSRKLVDIAREIDAIIP